MGLKRLTGVLLGLVAALTFISFVDVWWIPGTQMWLTAVVTLLTFIFALLHAGQRLGWAQAILLLAVVFVVSLLFESVGVATGAIYGAYHYTDRLGPKIFGLVPILIPVAWFMMMYASFVIADRLIPDRFRSTLERKLFVAGIGAIIMTSWDLAMDPLMVASGHWVWEEEGAYFGITVQNFWGWWLTSFVALAVYQVLSPSLPRVPVPADAPPFRWAVYAYAIMGLSSVVINFSVGLSGPGMAGLFAMLPWILMGLINARS